MDPRNLGLSDDDLEALGYQVTRASDPSLPGGSTQGPASAGQPAPQPRGPSPARQWFWTLAILVGVSWFALPAQRMPDPVAANRPDTVFSSGRAMSQLVEIARAPRPVGSPEHRRVRGLLADRLAELDLDVEVRRADVLAVDSGVATLTTVHDVVGRRGGSEPTGTVVLAAHYDGVPISWGAADDGMGIAAILETLRATLGAPPLRNDLVVVLTDGDEVGGGGIRRILTEEPLGGRPAVVVAVDPAGVAGPARLMESAGAAEALLARLDAAVPDLVTSSTAAALGAASLGDPFATPLLTSPLPTLVLTSLHGISAHHAAADRPIHVDEATLQHHGAQLLAMTRTFGAAELAPVLETSPAPRSFVSIPLAGLVDVPADRAMVYSGVLVALLGLLGLLFRLRGGSLRRSVVGVVAGSLVVGLSAGAARGLVEALRRFHPEFGRVEGLVYDGGIHLMVLAGLVVALATGSYAVARLRFSQRELVLGALTVPVTALLWLTLAAPEAALGAQLAVLLGLLAVLPLALLPDGHHPGRWLRILLLVVSSAILLVLVPELELVATFLTLEHAPLVGALMGLGAVLLFPVGEWLVRPKGWWTPILATAVATAAFFLATPAARSEAAHPVPTSLVLLVDDTLTVSATPGSPPAEAVDSGTAGADEPDPTRWMPGRWLTVPGVGEEWAMSWVVGSEGSGSDPGALFLPDPPDGSWHVAGTGADARLRPATVRRVGDAVDGGRTTITLEITPALDAEMVVVRMPEDTPGAIVSAAGMSISPPAGGTAVRTLVRWGGVEAAPLTLVIETEGDASAALELIEHHLRPAQVLGEDFFQREDSVAPDASTGSDRIILRTRLRLPAAPPSA